MKVLSIGRDNACDIILNDEKDLISRRHAILYITSSGKMTLVGQGQNGTYVNGIRINPNIPYPVTRKDIISFAHVKQLDWKLVPNRFALIRALILILIIVLVVTGGMLFFINRDRHPVVNEASDNVPPVEVADDTVPSPQNDSTSAKKVIPQVLPSKEALKKKKEEEERKAAEAQKKRKEAEKKDSVKPEKVTPPII
ncbi:FHA domain-containing protein [uncultured Parabacteroides sp.]|jgi:pSer/pThr/pTyr-binding forkhead associated (FHA) protein|uniref:FHA domain-containing protein n=1 Tax=uncultured Parabacteroides sp. TaxID=512312 RepID=UPI0025F415A4|nr:FHA domain-containing protein [uncultured Parabacteroides sp.]